MVSGSEAAAALELAIEITEITKSATGELIKELGERDTRSWVDGRAHPSVPKIIPPSPSVWKLNPLPFVEAAQADLYHLPANPAGMLMARF